MNMNYMNELFNPYFLIKGCSVCDCSIILFKMDIIQFVFINVRVLNILRSTEALNYSQKGS